MDITMNGIALVVMAGLMGAPHCAAMCGGIVSSVALRAQGSPMKPVLAYNAGRVVTYSAIGGFMGLAGSFLDAAGGLVGLQAVASLLGGAFILLWTLRRYVLPIFHSHPDQNSRIQGEIHRLGQKYETLAAFLTGILLGFMPCGLTYAMQMNAAASGTAAEGSLIMLVFGLATFPILLLTAISAGSLTRRWRRFMRKAGGYLAVLMGSLCILKGLSANGWIPSIHPWLW